MKWNIHPDKDDIYLEWAENAIKRTLTSSVAEFRAYRPVTGESQVATTYEFANMEEWSNWQKDENVQNVLNELRSYAVDIKIELWGPSPVAPAPVYFY